MLLLILLLHLVAQGAAEITVRQATHVQPDPAAATSRCPDPNNCRSLSDIIWSCLVTIFTCTWLAIHPNVPAPGDSLLRINLRRAGVAMVGLLFPELVILWAMRQWYMARFLAQKYEEYGWTQTHGFFAIMGGLAILGDDGAHHPILLSDLEKHLVAGDFKITREEIEDKSKGDILSKGIVLFQTGWFILQLIARAITRLPVTELEVVALAFASLNFATYGLWWHKPLDVHWPVVLLTTVKLEDVDRSAVLEIDQGFVTPSEEPKVGRNNLWRRGVCSTCTALISWLRDVSVKQVTLGVAKGVTKLIDDLFDRSNRYDFVAYFKDRKRVPTFYWGTDLANSQLFWSFGRNMNWIVMLVATVFGAIHCVAWSAQCLQSWSKGCGAFLLS